MHEFEEDFYGEQLRVCVAGYIRPEKKFDSVGKTKLSLKGDQRYLWSWFNLKKTLLFHALVRAWYSCTVDPLPQFTYPNIMIAFVVCIK